MLPMINVFGKEISSYAIMAILGLVSAILVIIYITGKKKDEPSNYVSIFLLSAIFLFLFSHILYGITNIDKIIYVVKNPKIINNFETFKAVFGIIFGGSVFYGGLIGLLFGLKILSKKIKVDKVLMYDLAGVVIPLFHFFGRIGCFLMGCCYGVESEFGFTYTHSLGDGDGVSRFPIQLLEAFFNLIIFIVLFNFIKKDKHKKYLLNIYLFVYPIGRFIFEFFRGDSIRGFLFGLSTSQIISILLLTFNIIYLIRDRKKK